jgi:hypothetical protein
MCLLAGCGGGATGGWTKAGADDAAVASAYRDCLDVTTTATKTDLDIDQDIAASRAADLHHSALLRAQAEQTRDDNRDRADAIVASCMQIKGFNRP